MIVQAYRGEQCSTPLLTRHPGWYFASSREAAQVYARSEQGRIIKAELTMERPFLNTPQDPYLEASHLIEHLGILQARRIVEQYRDWVMATNYWEELALEWSEVMAEVSRWRELYFQAYPYFASHEEVARLRALGYDGAVHGGSNVTACQSEYVVFDQAQIQILESIPV